VLPNRERDDFVTNLATVGYARDAARTSQWDGGDHGVENAFWSRADFERRAGILKYCQKEWPNPRMDRVVANIMPKRELN